MKVESQIRMVYEYDMGDAWEHQITLFGRADRGLHIALSGSKAPKVLCLSGEGHPLRRIVGARPAGRI